MSAQKAEILINVYDLLPVSLPRNLPEALLLIYHSSQENSHQFSGSLAALSSTPGS